MCLAGTGGRRARGRAAACGGAAGLQMGGGLRRAGGAIWAKIAKKVHKPPLGVNVINFEFNGFNTFIQDLYHRSPGVPWTPKSYNVLIEVFKLIRDVETLSDLTPIYHNHINIEVCKPFRRR